MGGKTLLVAEKPAQAKDFYVRMVERCTGEKFTDKKTYFESPNYYISWFAGHLLRALYPNEYDDKYKDSKDPSVLPIIPEHLSLAYKDDRAEKQGHVVLGLANKSDKIICGTDPDREGQRIFHEFFVTYHKMSEHKMYRIWSPSLTDKDLDKAWKAMKPYSDYDRLSTACGLRARADWLIGMNGCRAYSIAGGGSVSVGRVQTAVLRMIVDRDAEVKNYEEAFYHELHGKWAGINFVYYQDKEKEFEDEKVAKSVFDAIKPLKFKLSEFKEESRIKNPPKPFNLSAVQKVANKKYGFKPDYTLELVQELYLAKVVTYPRTESPYLPESDLADYHALVRKVASDRQKEFLIPATEKPVCVKNTESPHTALIITGESPSNIKGDELLIYELIKERFIVAFMQPNKFWFYPLVITDAGAGAEDAHILRSNVRVSQHKGFLAYVADKGEDFEDEDDKKEKMEEYSERLSQDKLGNIEEPLAGLDVQKFKRSKPKYYTPASLITAMMNCGKNVTNPKYRKILSEVKGIGTPATQATFPPKLIAHGLITEVADKEKAGQTFTHYESTDKGRKLIDLVVESVKSPELTAEWEMKLKLIESGDMESSDFEREIRGFTSELVTLALSSKGKVKFGDWDGDGKVLDFECPVCGGELKDGKYAYICSNVGCEYKFNKKQRGVVLTDAQLRELFVDGSTSKPVKCISKDKKHYEMRLKLDANEGYGITVQADFDILEEFRCPKCGKDVQDFVKGYSCVDRNGCGWKVWDNQLGTRPSEKILVALAKGEVVAVKKKSKAGKTYETKIHFTEGKEVEEMSGKLDIKCPACGSDLREWDENYSCTNKECKWRLYKNEGGAGVGVTTDHVRELVDKREVGPLQIVSKSGKPVTVTIRLKDDNFPETIYEKSGAGGGGAGSTGYKCTKCGEKDIMDSRYSYMCECGFKINKGAGNGEAPGVTLKDLGDFVEKGETDVIAMVNKDGVVFHARLKREGDGSAKFLYEKAKAGIDCPKCGGDLVYDSRIIECDTCQTKVWRNGDLKKKIEGVPLSAVKQAIEKGESASYKCVGRDGSIYTAKLTCKDHEFKEVRQEKKAPVKKVA